MGSSRYLAFDLGERRIGLAVGDDAGGIARPLRSLRRRGGEADLEAVRAIARSEEVEVLLFGLPLTLRGEEGTEARRARALGERIASALDLPFEFVDERFTTRQAARYSGGAAAARRGARRHATGNKFDIDAAAATLLLQGYLDRRRRR